MTKHASKHSYNTRSKAVRYAKGAIHALHGGYKIAKKIQSGYSHSHSKTKGRQASALSFISQHGDMGMKKMSLILNRHVKLKPFGDITLYENYSQKVVVGGGQQMINPYGSGDTANALIPRYFNKLFIMGNGTSAGGNALGPWAEGRNPLYVSGSGPAFLAGSLFDLNVQNLASSNITKGYLQNGVTSRQDVICLRSVDEHIQLKNFSSVPVDVHVVWFMTHKNTDKSIADVWLDELLSKGVGQPTVAVGTTPNVGGVTAGSPAMNYFPEYEVYQSKLVNKFFKPVRHCSFVLQGGDVQKIHMTVVYNRVIKQQNIIENDVNSANLQGITIVPVVFANGSPIINTDVQKVTTSVIDLGSVVERTYKFTLIEDSQRFNFAAFAPQLPIVTPVAGLVPNTSNVNDVDAIDVERIA